MVHGRRGIKGTWRAHRGGVKGTVRCARAPVEIANDARLLPPDPHPCHPPASAPPSATLCPPHSPQRIMDRRKDIAAVVQQLDQSNVHGITPKQQTAVVSALYLQRRAEWCGQRRRFVRLWVPARRSYDQLLAQETRAMPPERAHAARRHRHCLRLYLVLLEACLKPFVFKPRIDPTGKLTLANASVDPGVTSLLLKASHVAASLDLSSRRHSQAGFAARRGSLAAPMLRHSASFTGDRRKSSVFGPALEGLAAKCDGAPKSGAPAMSFRVRGSLSLRILPGPASAASALPKPSSASPGSPGGPSSPFSEASATPGPSSALQPVAAGKWASLDGSATTGSGLEKTDRAASNGTAVQGSHSGSPVRRKSKPAQGPLVLARRRTVSPGDAPPPRRESTVPGDPRGLGGTPGVGEGRKRTPPPRRPSKRTLEHSGCPRRAPIAQTDEMRRRRHTEGGSPTKAGDAQTDLPRTRRHTHTEGGSPTKARDVRRGRGESRGRPGGPNNAGIVARGLRERLRELGDWIGST